MKQQLLSVVPANLPGPVAGVDEVGRGPLAGPVVAAAVVLPADFDPCGLNDSKKLSPARRGLMAQRIRDGAVAWAVGEASAQEIDRLNILQATFLAMRRALEGLKTQGMIPGSLLVDGNQKIRGIALPQQCEIKGDGRFLSIAAASILAKVERDTLLECYAREWPAYGFERHKGYPTPEHLEALRKLGPCPEHRRSFAPVAACSMERM